MVNDLLAGFRCALSGFSLLPKKGITRFIVVPLTVNVIIFSGALWFGYTWLDSALDKLLGWMPTWMDWLASIIWPLMILLVLIVVYFSFSIVANLIAAPFNSLLAEKTEAILTGASIDGQGYRQIPGMVARSIWSEIRKLIYQIKWFVLLLILSFIPILNAAAPLLWIVFGAWMMAVNYADYPMGNHNRYFREVRQTLRQDRWFALGFGGGITLVTLIPVVNFVAMPLGVVSATRYWVDRLRDDGA